MVVIFLPGHPAVDGKVDGVGEAEAHVHHQDYLLSHAVVHELIQTKQNGFKQR